MSKLPWSTSSYKKLEPGDLLPTPPPTPEQRLRVAAAIATVIRDARMTRKEPGPNAETIRAVLVMDAKAWERDAPSLAKGIWFYDDEDPKVRFEQANRRKP